MSRSITDQTLALAGVFQAATLVHQIAHGSHTNSGSLESSLKSLFVTSADSTEEVFGELKHLREGLATLSAVLSQQSRKQDADMLRYGLNLIQLESKLNGRKDMLAVISSRIDQARHTADHFGYTHPNLVGNLASIYTDTISTFRLRIQVTGDPNVLQVNDNAAKVRALLLAGIRSAVLWRQSGGRRWQLVLRRRKVIETAQDLAEQANRAVYD